MGAGIKARFEAKVDRSGGPDACHAWTAAKNVHGYGEMWVGQRAMKAHRVAWELANGPIMAGLVVCHRCDNRACVNTAHLFVGTVADNNRDMIEKGRGVSVPCPGEANGRAKLSADDVAEIRNRAASGETRTAIASSFCVSRWQICRIVNGTRWTARGAL